MTYGISIAICTMDRTDVLRRCLDSIAAGSSLPEAVLVSDDSVSPDATRSLCAAYSFVTYLAGPRGGLCANRNHVVRTVQTSHVCLLDDDSTVEADFVEKARLILPALDGRTIVTGDVLEYGGRTRPMNPTFWGHFKADPRGHYKTINLNCNLFPIESFRQAQFDESVIYGYEDMDLCACLLSKGFRIRYEPTLANRHLPPEKPAAETRRRHRLVQLARFQVTTKRYLIWEKRPLKCAAFCILAPLHRAAHAAKSMQWGDLPQAASDMVLALAGALEQRAAFKSEKAFVRGTRRFHGWFTLHTRS